MNSELIFIEVQGHKGLGLSLLTMGKRAFDFIMASVGLILLSPLLLVVAVLVKLDSTGPALFRQKRVGRGFRLFEIYKFRTMVEAAPQRSPQLTIGHDPRITWMGRILRATKVDELPQLLNVLKGDMSFVGPRPEVPQYVDLFRSDYEEILRIRPGITDLASLKYRDESEVLAQFSDPEQAYREKILPDKIRLAKEYLHQASFLFDLRLIGKTLLRVAARGTKS
jgi:lipopolysaccharide/colanic/teichoic acid biosynthesis glycosyltransferase